MGTVKTTLKLLEAKRLGILIWLAWGAFRNPSMRKTAGVGCEVTDTRKRPSPAGAC